ncbi:hypothetical protein PR048_031506 [Dryococelus australis]|uniref:Uncharacterized protein n=1 Tax=Dryococelus australis TaxID=614101 RepID=A0ABQ9G8F8_9NEOP|nr:hypothetical protein PR048_031506 [Dryococelus australis]
MLLSIGGVQKEYKSSASERGTEIVSEDNQRGTMFSFTENCNCKYSEEVQSVHFDGSRNQIALHTSVVYYCSKTENKLLVGLFVHSLRIYDTTL